MSEGIDPMDPERVEARWVTDADASDDYRDLWSRCQKAEAERDARAEVGYAVEARALREQLATQRKDFEARLSGKTMFDAVALAEEKWKARLDAADELAEAAENALNGPPMALMVGWVRFEAAPVAAALARFRDSKEETK